MHLHITSRTDFEEHTCRTEENAEVFGSGIGCIRHHASECAFRSGNTGHMLQRQLFEKRVLRFIRSISGRIIRRCMCKVILVSHIVTGTVQLRHRHPVRLPVLRPRKTVHTRQTVHSKEARLFGIRRRSGFILTITRPEPLAVGEVVIGFRTRRYRRFIQHIESENRTRSRLVLIIRKGIQRLARICLYAVFLDFVYCIIKG